MIYGQKNIKRKFGVMVMKVRYTIYNSEAESKHKKNTEKLLSHALMQSNQSSQ